MPMDGGARLEFPSGLIFIEEKDTQDSEGFQEDQSSGSMFALESGAGTREEPVLLSDE